MLNYSCKKVLNCLIKIQNQNIEFNGRETLALYLPKWIMKNIDYIMEYLSDNEYLSYLPADNDYYSFDLTYKGLAHKSFYFEEVKEFIFKSITVPIIVSIITSILTTYILQWLQGLR